MAAGAPIATFFATYHLLNSRNQKILKEKERVYEALLAENTSTKEEITVPPKEEKIQETIVDTTTIPQDAPKMVDEIWIKKEEEYKSQIKLIEESKKKLEKEIKRKIWDYSDVLTQRGLAFFKKSKFISAWENLTRIESTGSRSSGALFNNSMHYEEAFDLFWYYKSYEYSSGKDLMKYLVPGDWYLLKSSDKVKLYFFLLPYTEIKRIVEALREPHSGSGHSTYNHNNYLNEYMKPFEEQKKKINNWNKTITVEFLANSYRHNVFNSHLHPSSHSWRNPGWYKIKPIEKLDIGEIFKSEEDKNIALKILFFLHLTSQYTLAKTSNNLVSFGIGDPQKASDSFFKGLYENKLTIKTNNFPSAESFLHYLILKVLEYKNNFGKVNLIDSVHPAFFS